MTTSSSATSAGTRPVYATYESGSNTAGGYMENAEVDISRTCDARGGTLEGRRTFDFKEQDGKLFIEFKQNCKAP